MRLLSNLKYFIKRNKPVIMRQQTFDAYVIRAINNALDMADKNRWRVLNPVICDLERLRANTWDQDKITHIQNWLRNNFKYARKYNNDN